MSRTPPLPAFTTGLKEALEEGLRELGIRAVVGFKMLAPTRVFRVYVVSPDFDALRFQERQDIVWRIVGEHLDPSEQNRISMIVTATRDEVADDEDAPDTTRRRAESKH